MAKLIGFVGSTFAVSFTCKDADGDAVDLTDYSARSQLRPSVNSATLTLDLSPTIGTPTSGVIDISVADEDTADISPGTYYFDLLLDDPDGAVINLAGGTVVFRKQVTKE